MKPYKSLGKILTKIFDPITREIEWVGGNIQNVAPSYYQIGIFGAILAAEKEPRFKPFANRTPLVCSNLAEGIGSICNPCGEECSWTFKLGKSIFYNLVWTTKVGDYCPNGYCALGCADGDIENRLGTYYNPSSDEHRIDFNFCHPLWQKHYIDIRPPSQDYKLRYIAIGSTAAAINLLSLATGFYFFYLLAKEKCIIDEVIAGYSVSSRGEKFKLLLKYLIMLAPFLIQAMDSILDATYFIELKTELRIIHVPPNVQVAQAILLFTCKNYFYNCS